VSPLASSNGNGKWRADEPRTPNRTCFIVDELPKIGGGAVLSTPSSINSFDRSENVTVVENVRGVVGQGVDDDNDDRQLIIDPPTPFVDRVGNDDADSLSDGPDTPPDHTSTPKSTKNGYCTPKPNYRKESRKPTTNNDRRYTNDVHVSGDFLPGNISGRTRVPIRER